MSLRNTTTNKNKLKEEQLSFNKSKLFNNSETNLINSEDDLKFQSPDTIKNINNISFSPYLGELTPIIEVSPYEFNSHPQGIADQVPMLPKSSYKKVATTSTIKKSNGKANEVNCMMKEVKELRQKYEKLEKELASVKKSKTVKTEPKKSEANKLAKRNKRTLRKEATEEEKQELVEKINKLSLDDKKGIRAVLKDHIKLFPGGQFEFNINKLPINVFDELKKYLEKCLNTNPNPNSNSNTYPNNINTIPQTLRVNTLEVKEIPKIINDNLPSPRDSTVESEENIKRPHLFIGSKRNFPLKEESDISSSSLDSSSLESDSSSDIEINKLQTTNNL